MRRELELLFVAAILAVLLSLNGCVGPIAASNLTVEQIQAMKDTNGDLFICLSGVGPPGNAGITVLLLPKGTKPDIVFTPNCQIQNGRIQ